MCPLPLFRFQGEGRLWGGQVDHRWMKVNQMTRESRRQWCVILCLLQLKCFSGFLHYKMHGVFIKYTWLYNLIVLIPTLKARYRANCCIVLLAFLPQPVKVRNLHLSEFSENNVSPFFYLSLVSLHGGRVLWLICGMTRHLLVWVFPFYCVYAFTVLHKVASEPWALTSLWLALWTLCTS